jgi:hypothetical protein
MADGPTSWHGQEPDFDGLNFRELYRRVREEDEAYEEPTHRWVDIDNIFAQAHLQGEQSSNFFYSYEDSSTLRVYLDSEPFNLWIGQPKYPAEGGGLAYWIQKTTPLDTPDIESELFLALEAEPWLFKLISKEKLRNVGRCRTEEILELIRRGRLIPFSEFTPEKGDYPS